MPELAETTGVRRQPTPHVVGLAQVEQIVDRLHADLPDEPADGGVGPGRLVAEHVLPDEQDDALAHRPWRPKAVEQRPGEVGADAVVPEEVSVGQGRGLPDVVEERREAHDRPIASRRVDRPQGVRPEILAGHLVLRHAALGRELRRDRGEEPGVGHQPEPDRRTRRPQQLPELGRDPLAGQVDGKPRTGLDPGQRRGLDREVVGRREPDRPDHPERVLLEPDPRLTDGPQRSGLEVAPAVVGIDQRRGHARDRSPGHRVDREVAAREVELDRVAELDRVRTAEVAVLVVAPERRDRIEVGAGANGHRPERVLVDRPGEQLEEPVRPGVRGEIPVVRRPTEERVPNRPADDVGRATGRPEGPQQLVDRSGDRARDAGQLRPRNRYVRHASFRSSERYGVNSE